jgi:tetratricopeptide (TPR) repeat protein
MNGSAHSCAESLEMDTQSLLKQASDSHKRGDLPAAESGYSQILAAEPDHADALFLSATLRAQRAEWDDAQLRLQRLLASHPEHAEGWLNLAHVLQQCGQSEQAIPCYDAYLQLRPGDAQNWFELGLACFQAKRFDRAEQAYRRYLQAVPDSLEGHFNLGATLHDAHELEAAKQEYRHVLQLDPTQVEAYRGLGNIALHERHYSDAVMHFSKALEIAPQDVELLSNLGVMLQKVGRLEEAERILREAVRVAPEHVNAHFNLGLVLLLQGNFHEGWTEYAWRHRIKGRTPVRFDQPEWDGSPLGGRTILLRAEQGFGDTFQFVRYAPLLKAMGARVVVECQPGLKRILLRTPGIDMISERPASGQPLVDFDRHAPLLELPRLFATDAQNIPTEFPYIRPEPWLVERWAARLAEDRQLRVGIVWAGRPTHEDDQNRSCSLAHFLRLASVPGITLYSLQKGSAVQALALPDAVGKVVDLDPEIDDFADTAAAITNLDLVICVDTSVAHLAGAMGKPVWVVLPFAPDWRWLAQGEHNPWYPSARLFRQEATGDWDALFDRLRDALAIASQAHRPRGSGSATPALHYEGRLIGELRQARQALRRGDWQRAEALCHALLAHWPEHAEASWLAGFAQFSLGRAGDALSHLVVAYEAWPQHPLLLKILGMALQTLDQRPEAEQCYLAALQSGNDDPEVLFNFGVLKHMDGQLEAAVALYQTAMALKPEFPDCLNNLGLALRALGRLDEAMARFREALALRPDFFDSILNLGNAVFLTGQTEEAVDWFRRAVQLRGAHAGAHNSLGVALKALGRVDEAIDEFGQAVRFEPTLAEAHSNLGNALKLAGRLPAAVAAYRAALEINPQNALVWTNQGSALQQGGAIAEALEAFEQAVTIDPDLPEAHWNRALAWLAMGDYERGWPEYEWGFRAGARPLPSRKLPRWNGDVMPGKTLLVSAEQGFGDAIQFVRFIGQARARVGKVLLECRPELSALLSTCAGVDQVISPDTPDTALPEVAARIPLMSLAGALGVRRDDLPGPYPYLSIDAARVGRPASVIGTDGFKVGLVWGGSSAHQDDWNRSCAPALLSPLLAVAGARFFSLQKGRDPGELRSVGAELQDLASVLEDFADTAAAIAGLDLVITVDTAVAHLAGAMGKPVWVLLPFAPDWRWGLHEDSTPWYPSARLFRQPRPGDWKSVMASVLHALGSALHKR